MPATSRSARQSPSLKSTPILTLTPNTVILKVNVKRSRTSRVISPIKRSVSTLIKGNTISPALTKVRKSASLVDVGQIFAIICSAIATVTRVRSLGVISSTSFHSLNILGVIVVAISTSPIVIVR